MGNSNIRTLPQVAFWNFEGEWGFLGLEFWRHRDGTQFGIPNAWRGGFSSEFSETEDSKIFA